MPARCAARTWGGQWVSGGDAGGCGRAHLLLDATDGRDVPAKGDLTRHRDSRLDDELAHQATQPKRLAKKNSRISNEVQKERT